MGTARGVEGHTHWVKFQNISMSDQLHLKYWYHNFALILLLLKHKKCEAQMEASQLLQYIIMEKPW